MINLDKLERDAGDATPGEWRQDPELGEYVLVGEAKDPDIVSTSYQKDDARHIANMDPPTTLALIKAVRGLAAEISTHRNRQLTGREYHRTGPIEAVEILAEHGLEDVGSND